MLGPALSTFKAQASGDLATALLASVEDSVRGADEAVGELETQRAAREAQRVLSYRDLVQYESWTAMFRTLAMAERLARLTGASDISAVARDRLAKRAGAFQRSARLRPVSLRSSTELQISAILATAADDRPPEATPIFKQSAARTPEEGISATISRKSSTRIRKA